MQQAEFLTFLYGASAGFSLLAGGVLAWWLEPGRRALSWILGFSAGALIASTSAGLVEEAYQHGGLDATAVGLLAGAALYYAAHFFLPAHPDAEGPHMAGVAEKGQVGRAILAAAVLDGFPEQLVIGVTSRLGTALALTLAVAVAITNLPEALVATRSLSRSIPRARVLLLWLGLGLGGTAVTMLGYTFSHHLTGDFFAALVGLAAGAVVAMVADTLLPEAFRGGGHFVSLVTVFGFLVGFALSRL